MDLIDKIKNNLKNLDVNSTMSYIVSAIGTMTTEGWINMGYFLIAFITACFTWRQSLMRNRQDNQYRQLDIDLKYEDLREKRLINDKKAKENDE